MKVAVFNTSKGISFLTVPEGSSLDDEMKRIYHGKKYTLVYKEDIPKIFPSSLVLKNGVVVVDEKKAVEEQKNKIRAQREDKFKKLDLEFMKTGINPVDEKQKLRDATDSNLFHDWENLEELNRLTLDKILKEAEK